MHEGRTHVTRMSTLRAHGPIACIRRLTLLGTSVRGPQHDWEGVGVIRATHVTRMSTLRARGPMACIQRLTLLGGSVMAAAAGEVWVWSISRPCFAE